ncbi:hypothetical protein D9M69_512470 [compost metagenome]
MSNHFISAKTRSANSVYCDRCNQPAAFIQMTYNHEHDPDNHWVLCNGCRFNVGLELCECCEMSEPFEAENADGTRVYLMPAYHPEELDSDGTCSEHP